MTKKIVIGLMSGTSGDGLDITACRFFKEGKAWNYQIISSETINYSDFWKKQLRTADKLETSEFLKLDLEYGKYLGQQVNDFLKRHKLAAELIGTHGHTIFHKPGKGLTYQLGAGNALFYETRVPVISDFRIDDVLSGGQGAPLAPAGDYYLFQEYDFRLNLGGFSNISFSENGIVYAFDICPVNYVLNREAGKLGKTFDHNGFIASENDADIELLNALNQMKYYNLSPPKSLSREWVEQEWDSVIRKFSLSPGVKIATITEHITDQLAEVLNRGKNRKNVLITGGGAKNKYLIQRLKQKIRLRIIIPDEEIIEYKEALIFAFLALLKQRGQINIFSSVTGASEDLSAGILYV